MDENQTIDQDRILKINIEEEMKSSYIDYSMSVIVARALPDVRDGFKPVHRRILFGMRGIGNFSIHMVIPLFMVLWCEWAKSGICATNLLTDKETSARLTETLQLPCDTPSVVWQRWVSMLWMTSKKIPLIW